MARQRMRKMVVIVSLSIYFGLFTLLGYVYAGPNCCDISHPCSGQGCNALTGCIGAVACDASSFMTCDGMSTGCPNGCTNSMTHPCTLQVFSIAGGCAGANLGCTCKASFASCSG
jgi:hypothetical protein